MKPRLWFLIGLTGASLAVTGCGKKSTNEENHAGHDHDKHAHEEAGAGESPQTTFKEGVGLSFPEETRQALGLTTGEVGEKSLPCTLTVTAQVFSAGNPSLASASVTPEVADLLRDRKMKGSRIVRIDRGAASATGEADLVLQLDSQHAVGDFVSVTLTSEDQATVVVIPRSALLQTTTGTFVYVANGNSYLRNPVKVGKVFPDQVEITDGLYAGDVVVTKPVEQLWLSELRFTKGGGHSH